MPRRTHQKGSLDFVPNAPSSFRIREYNHQAGTWKMKRFQIGTFQRRKDAEKAADKIRETINERNNATAKSIRSLISFREFIELYWKEYAKREGFQPSTMDSRLNILEKHLLPVFGEMKLSEIKPNDVTGFMNRLYQKGLQTSSILFIYTFAKSVFALAAQYDLVKKNPVRAKRHRPKVPKSKKPVLTGKQVGEVIGKLPNRDEKMMALLLSLTGLRVGEALALRWQDFDMATGELTINHTLYKEQLKKPKTEGSEATFVLEPIVADLLRSHYRQATFNDAADFIFCRSDARPLHYSTCIKHLHDAIEGAGIEQQKSKYGFHIFRHTAGSLAYQKSRDLKAVQNLLRHSEIGTTSDLYVHASGEEVAEQFGHLADEILPNCDLTVTEESEMVN